MFHDLKLYLEQDEQLHDMYENLFHFYESIQDKLMTDNQVLNSIETKKQFIESEFDLIFT
jgi:hypothetical protein